MALTGLDPVIHPAKRLAAVAILSAAGEADFRYLKEQLGLNDSDLSKQMTALQEASYVQVIKSGRGRGARTAYRLTAAGKAAYLAHRAALRALLAAGDAN